MESVITPRSNHKAPPMPPVEPAPAAPIIATSERKRRASISAETSPPPGQNASSSTQLPAARVVPSSASTKSQQATTPRSEGRRNSLPQPPLAPPLMLPNRRVKASPAAAAPAPAPAAAAAPMYECARVDMHFPLYFNHYDISIEKFMFFISGTMPSVRSLAHAAHRPSSHAPPAAAV